MQAQEGSSGLIDAGGLDYPVAGSAGTLRAPVESEPRPPLFTRGFLLLMNAWVFASMAHSLLFWGVVPFLVSVGVEPGQAGVALAAIPFTSLAARVPVGRLIDRYGSRRPAIAGAWMMFASAMLYVLSAVLHGGATTWPLLVASLALQGFGLSAMGTASFTYLGIVAAQARRGQATGYYGLAGPLLQGVAAAAVYAITASAGFITLYVVIAAIAAVSTVSFIALAEERPAQKITSSIRGLLVVGRAIGVPAITSGLLAFTYGAARVAVPILAIVSGIANPGLFFLAMAMAGAGLRLATGGVWDRLGRRTVAIPGLIFIAASFVLLPMTAVWGDAAFVASGAVYGMAASCSIPALQAMVLDRGLEDRRGASSAAMWMLTDIGMGFGTLLGGLVVTASDAGGGLALAVAAPLVGAAIIVIDASSALRPALVKQGG
jgi:MFS family permease